MDPAPLQCHDKIGMMMARHHDRPCHYVMEEVNGVTIQLPEDGHVGFPTPYQLTRQIRSFILRKSVVRSSAPFRLSASPPVRLSTPLDSFARSLVHLSACPPSSARPHVHPSTHPLVCPPQPPPSASFHPWSFVYKLLVVEAEHAQEV